MPPLFPILSQTNPIDIVPFCFLKWYFILLLLDINFFFKSTYHKFVFNYFLYVPHSPPISFSSMYLVFYEYSYRTHHYLIFLTLVLFSPSHLLISVSASFPRTPPVYVIPSSWDQDSHTHIEQLTKYSFCYFSIYVANVRREETNLNQTVATWNLNGYRARRGVADRRGPVLVAGLSLNK
jgi:hypothetical protein